MEKYSLLTKLAKYTLKRVKNCRSKKGLKQCLGGLKCCQNTQKNKKTLKVSFKAIFGKSS